MTAQLDSRLELLPPRREGGRHTPVLRLHGRLDAAAVPAFRLRMRELVGAGTICLVLDMSEVVSLDSSGLGAVIGGLKLAREAGGDLRLAVANRQVLRTLEMTSLDRVLLPYRSVEEAARDLHPEPVEITLLEGEPRLQLDAVHEAFGRFVDQLVEAPADEWRLLFEMAVAEIAANIVEHARPPMIGFRLAAQGRRFVAEFTDTGIGWHLPPGPAGMVDLLVERGRGLGLAQKAVDELAYERQGAVNRWRLTKHY